MGIVLGLTGALIVLSLVMIFTFWMERPRKKVVRRTKVIRPSEPLDTSPRECTVCMTVFQPSNKNAHDPRYCVKCWQKYGNTYNRSGFVYVLIDPRDGVIRYVGMTVKPRMRRSSHLHCFHSRRLHNVELRDWVKALFKLDLEPIFEIVERVDIAPPGLTPEMFTHEREHFWMKAKEWEGHPLLNRARPKASRATVE